MTFRKTGTFLLGVALLGLSPGAARAQVLYGITFSGNQLITINTTTAAGTLVGPLSSSMNAYGMACQGSNLYAYDQTAKRIRQLDPATAATMNTIDIGALLFFGEGGMAFRNDGIGFVSDGGFGSGRLIRFDMTVPDSTVIGTMPQGMDGLAFNTAGVLYGLSEAGARLFTIDQATAATTLVGNTGIPAAIGPGFAISGLAFDGSGNLFASVSTSGGGVSLLYRLDTTTGTATLVGDIGFTTVSDIGFRTTPPPPPPPPGSLYGVGFNTNQLITINTSTGAGTLVGPLTPPGLKVFGIGFRGSKLYTWDEAPANRIKELDPATAAVLNSIDIASTAFGEGDITFRSDGIGFLSGVFPSQLVRFDVTVPSSTVIGPLNPKMDGLAFNPAGVLYGLKEGGDQLYTIDPTSGATTLVGNTSITGFPGVPPGGALGGLAFAASGQLFAVLSNDPASPSSLYQINPSTGAATLIGSIGFNGVCGLAFQPVVPPPPPPPSLPPPAPPPMGSGNEGSYGGSSGSAGPEGGFGLGGRTLAAGTHKNRLPTLLGPFLDTSGSRTPFGNLTLRQFLPSPGANLTVYNVAYRQKVQADHQQVPDRGTLLLGVILGLIVLLVTKIRRVN